MSTVSKTPAFVPDSQIDAHDVDGRLWNQGRVNADENKAEASGSTAALKALQMEAVAAKQFASQNGKEFGTIQHGLSSKELSQESASTALLNMADDANSLQAAMERVLGPDGKGGGELDKLLAQKQITQTQYNALKSDYEKIYKQTLDEQKVYKADAGKLTGSTTSTASSGSTGSTKKTTSTSSTSSTALTAALKTAVPQLKDLGTDTSDTQANHIITAAAEKYADSVANGVKDPLKHFQAAAQFWEALAKADPSVLNAHSKYALGLDLESAAIEDYSNTGNDTTSQKAIVGLLVQTYKGLPKNSYVLGTNDNIADFLTGAQAKTYAAQLAAAEK